MLLQKTKKIKNQKLTKFCEVVRKTQRTNSVLFFAVLPLQ